jgi:hypothetical protein
LSAVPQTAIERRFAFELNNTPHSTEALLSYLQQCADHETYMTQSQVSGVLRCHTNSPGSCSLCFPIHQLFEALNYAGIFFSSAEVQQFAAGFAADGNGRIKVREVAEMV